MGLSLMRAVIHHLSPNYNQRPDGGEIDCLVLHYTGMESAAAALERLCDPVAEVSAHYLVDEQGTVFQLVEEKMRAWHAGVSFWRGQSGLNHTSIGIEIVNPGHEFGYRAFPEVQIASVIELCQGILTRHPRIEARNVIGHSDIAPRRKQDPGELFPWQCLAENGVGLWPQACEQTVVPDRPVAEILAQIGYEIDDVAASLMAFQRHFCPDHLDGLPNPATLAMLRGYLTQIPSVSDDAFA